MPNNISRRKPIGNFYSNLQRNERLYGHWKKGNTILLTAELTRIPKSTVGYYFHKFDKYAAKGKAVPIGNKAMVEENYLNGALARSDALRRERLKVVVDQLESQGKLDEARNFLELEEKKQRMGLGQDPILENVKENLDPFSRLLMENLEQLQLIQESETPSSARDQQTVSNEAWNIIMRMIMKRQETFMGKR